MALPKGPIEGVDYLTHGKDSKLAGWSGGGGWRGVGGSQDCILTSTD